MGIQQKHGQRSGLAERLDGFAERLAKDKSTPWLGLGLYHDLKAAAATIRGEPERAILDPKPALEFDL